MKAPILKSLRIRNFKAIRDSGSLKLTPLTVLDRQQRLRQEQCAGGDWKPCRSALKKTSTPPCKCGVASSTFATRPAKCRLKVGPTGELRSTKPIVFQLAGRTNGKSFKAETVWNERGAENELFFEKEIGPCREAWSGNEKATKPVPPERKTLARSPCPAASRS